MSNGRKTLPYVHFKVQKLFPILNFNKHLWFKMSYNEMIQKTLEKNLKSQYLNDNYNLFDHSNYSRHFNYTSNDSIQITFFIKFRTARPFLFYPFELRFK